MQGSYLEIGAYEGKYALLCAKSFVVNTEQIFLNDIFSVQENITRENREEIQYYYRNLSHEQLLNNLNRFNLKNFQVLHMPSKFLTGDLFSSSIRFIHIDGSHTYKEVVQDIKLALEIIDKELGLIVLDDY